MRLDLVALLPEATVAISLAYYGAFGRVCCGTAALNSAQKEIFETTVDCNVQPKSVYTYDVTDKQSTETGVNRAITATAI